MLSLTCVLSLFPPLHPQQHPVPPCTAGGTPRADGTVLCMWSFLGSVGRHTATEMTVMRKNICMLRSLGSGNRVMGEVPRLDKRQKGCRESQIFIVVCMGKKGSEAGHQSCRLRIPLAVTLLVWCWHLSWLEPGSLMASFVRVSLGPWTWFWLTGICQPWAVPFLICRTPS